MSTGIRVEDALAERGMKPGTDEQRAQNWNEMAASVRRSSDEKLRRDWLAAGCSLSDEDIARFRKQAAGPNPWRAGAHVAAYKAYEEAFTAPDPEVTS